jgi:hypothetical protein
MSKLAKLVEAHQTGKVKYMLQLPTIMRVEQDISEMRMDTLKREYRLSVVLQLKGYAQGEEELEYLIRAARKQMVEEVFGEFRMMLRKIENALYNLDIQEAKKLLSELDTEMFLT